MGCQLIIHSGDSRLAIGEGETASPKLSPTYFWIWKTPLIPDCIVVANVPANSIPAMPSRAFPPASRRQFCPESSPQSELTSAANLIPDHFLHAMCHCAVQWTT